MSETEQFLLWLKHKIERELVLAEAAESVAIKSKPCNRWKGLWTHMTPEDIDTIRTMGQQKRKIAEIAFQIGRERGTVRYWLKKLKLYNVRTKKHRVRGARRAKGSKANSLRSPKRRPDCNGD